ncbi:MAG: HAMP domain-containing sensor histidine kinase [Patescibacteria group bacterium]
MSFKKTNMPTKNKKPRRLIWITSFLALATVMIAISASWLLYQHTVTLITENLRERLLTISITEAANIDAKDIEALRVEDDWQKPEWARVVSKMQKAKYSNESIVFMYIFRKTKDDPNKMEFVADADSLNPFANMSGDPSIYVDVNRDGKIEPDGPDKLQWPGQPYPEAADIPETEQAYGGPITVKDLYTDEYGTVLTGYAPIKDDNGNTVAILGTDIKADDFFAVTGQTLYPFLAFIAFLVSIILTLAVVLIYIWRKQELALEIVNDRLKELDQLKSEFVSLATHQIRGPLASIKGYASLMIEGDYGEVPAQLNEPIDVIFRSSQSLAIVVDDFLNVSRIEQGKMKYDFTTFDLCALVQEVYTEAKPNIEKKGLSISSKCSPDTVNINGDRGKLKQVVGNILDNSIKYTPKGSINLSLTADKASGKAILTIKDTGVGIRATTIPHLFQKFSRAEDASKVNILGTGLGLYVAREMIEAHGGRIWVESPGLGQGSTFFVEFRMV